MFADTYARVFANAEREYGFKRFMSTHFYMHVTLPVPPPFNLFWSLWDMGFEILPQRILPEQFTSRRREMRKLRSHKNSRCEKGSRCETSREMRGRCEGV